VSSNASLETLWSGQSRTTLATALGDPEPLSSAEPIVLGRSFVRYAEMEPEESRAAALSLRQLVRRVLTAVEAPQTRLDRAYRRRSLHVGVVAFLAAVVFVLATAGREQREASRDLARDRPWKGSSHLMGGCKSPAQSCPESPMYFFHTKDDESPFLVIDLGERKRFSSLRIQNRIECCHDRGLPLMVEVSNDQKKWKQVAKREEEFDVWRPKFKTESARWVRLRAGSKTWLHFASVRVLP
jgi:hypothetical protein